MTETLAAAVERCAGYERRGLMLYRRLGERFPTEPAAAVWRQMSNAEAGHFTTLQLAGDWLTLAGAAETPLAADGAGALADRAVVERGLDELEATAGGAALTVAAAAALTLEWEELELPRVLALLAVLPPPVRQRVGAGILRDIGVHHGELLRLVTAAGAAGLVPRVEALARRGERG